MSGFLSVAGHSGEEDEGRDSPLLSSLRRPGALGGPAGMSGEGNHGNQHNGVEKHRWDVLRLPCHACLLAQWNVWKCKVSQAECSFKTTRLRFIEINLKILSLNMDTKTKPVRPYRNKLLPEDPPKTQRNSVFVKGFTLRLSQLMIQFSILFYFILLLVTL